MLLEMHHHPGNEQLELYSLGSLSDPALSELEEHLLVCLPCQTRVEQMDVYTHAMRGAALALRSQAAKPRVWSSWPGSKVAWAAGIAAVIVAFAVGLEWPNAVRHSGAPYSIALQTTRGDAPSNTAPHGRPLILNVDVTQLANFPSYQLQIVSSSGAMVWSSPGRSDSAGKITLPTNRELARGIYYVRIYSPTKLLLREFALEIE